MEPLLVKARLCSPVAGLDAPMLDSVLEKAIMADLPRIEKEVLGLPPIQAPFGSFRPELSRSIPIPRPWNGESKKGYERRYGTRSQLDRFWCERFYRWFTRRHEILPFAWGSCGGAMIPRSSSPILGLAHTDGVGYINKRIDANKASLMAPGKRRIMATGNSWTKAYRLPLRERQVDTIAWFIVGDAAEIRRLLTTQVYSLGKKRSVGYGRVRRWDVISTEEDYSWFARDHSVSVLMRPLPLTAEFPVGTLGSRRDFVAVMPPYFHPDNYQEAMVPC